MWFGVNTDIKYKKKHISFLKIEILKIVLISVKGILKIDSEGILNFEREVIFWVGCCWTKCTCGWNWTWKFISWMSLRERGRSLLARSTGRFLVYFRFLGFVVLSNYVVWCTFELSDLVYFRIKILLRFCVETSRGVMGRDLRPVTESVLWFERRGGF